MIDVSLGSPARHPNFLPHIRSHGEGGHIVNTASIGMTFERHIKLRASHCPTIKVNSKKEKIGSTSPKGLTFSIFGALLSVRYHFGKCRITGIWEVRVSAVCGSDPVPARAE